MSYLCNLITYLLPSNDTIYVTCVTLSSSLVIYIIVPSYAIHSHWSNMFSGMFNIWEVVDKLAAIAKKELFYIWPFGLSAYLAGVVFIDRSNAKVAYKQLKMTSDVMVKNKVSKYYVTILPLSLRFR